MANAGVGEEKFRTKRGEMGGNEKVGATGT